MGSKLGQRNVQLSFRNLTQSEHANPWEYLISHDSFLTLSKSHLQLWDITCNCCVNQEFHFRVGGSACGRSDMDQMAHVSASHCTGDELMCNGNTVSWSCEEVCSVNRFLWGLGRLHHLKSPSTDRGDSVMSAQHVKEMVQSSKMVETAATPTFASDGPPQQGWMSTQHECRNWLRNRRVWELIRNNAEMETAVRACLQMQELAFYRDVIFWTLG